MFRVNQNSLPNNIQKHFSTLHIVNGPWSNDVNFTKPKLKTIKSVCVSISGVKLFNNLRQKTPFKNNLFC